MRPIDRHHIATDEFLDLHIQAARLQFHDAAIEDSVRRMRANLSAGPRARRPSFVGLALVGAASILFVAISLTTFLLPGGDGSAFAQARRWLASFDTLQVETTVLEEDAVTDVLVWFDGSGDTRIETSGSITIVKPEEGILYMLRPDGHNVARRITPSDGIVEDSTALLDVIRRFEGEGELFAGSRIIDGVSAAGYELTFAQSTVVLWVDPSDGRPLQVDAQMPEGATIRSTLSFDLPLPANAFDVPDGVQILERQQ